MKLLDLLSILSKKEFQQLKIFISNPFFNTSNTSIALIDYLEPHFPDFSQIKKVDILSILENQLNLKQAACYRSLNRLTNLVQQYIALLAFKQDEQAQNELFIQGLKHRKSFKLFEKYIFELIEKTESTQSLNIDKYLHLSRLYHHHFFHPLTERIDMNNKSLDKWMSNLNQYFVLSKLKFACEKNSRSKVISNKHGIRCQDD